jgi:predicted nucleotidyltransferase
MLKRAESIPVLEGIAIRVVQVEDIIGLKIQASVNNPAREARDWADIRMLLEAAARQRRPVDWELLEDYLALFRLQARLPELKSMYGQTD